MSSPFQGTGINPPGSSAFAVAAPAVSSPQDSSGSQDPYGLGNIGGVTIFLGNIPVSTGASYMGGPNRPAPTTTKYQTSTVTATNYVTQFANSSVSNPQSFAATQAALYTAGFYGSSKPRFGVYTTDDAAAMKKAIQSYIGVVNPNDPNPLTFSDYLDHATAQSAANGDGGGTPPPPLSLTDPKELEQTLQAAGQNALGRNLSPDELKAFVSSFHGKEKASYNNQIAGKTYTNPDVSGEAVADVAAGHPVEEQQKLQAGYLDKMNEMLGVL